jgi:hypothetical protein
VRPPGRYIFKIITFLFEISNNHFASYPLEAQEDLYGQEDILSFGSGNLMLLQEAENQENGFIDKV